MTTSSVAPVDSVPRVDRPLQDPCFDGSYFVIYMFAGHQRPGDVHAASLRLGALFGFAMNIIPLDIIYHDTLCNLLLPETQAFWRRVTATGGLLGALGAPPCETWSVARWRSVFHADGGPKPARTSQEPWGRLSSSLRLQLQTLTANRLMHFWLVVALICIQVKTAFMMEHPAAPALACAASIWRVPQLLQLLQVPGCCSRNVLQGLYGAVSAKPTTLVTYLLPSFDRCLAKWRSPSPSSKWQQLYGKLATGEWKTQQAKAYPPHLNCAIMESFFDRAALLRSTGDQMCHDQLPADFFEAVASISRSMPTSGHDIWG